MKKVMKILARIIICIISFLFCALLTIYIIMCMMFSKNNTYIRRLAIATFLESGALKDVPKYFVNAKEINEILNININPEYIFEEDFAYEVNDNIATESEVKIKSFGENIEDDNYYNEDGVHIDKISRVGFDAKIMVIDKPERVHLSSSFPFELRYDLERLVKKEKAIAGINGGLYNYKDYPKTPIGVVVKDGNIEWLKMDHEFNLTLIAFDENNKLRIIEIGKKNAEDVEKIIVDNKIRDAVTFNEGHSYFTKLIKNGVDRVIDYNCLGINPRTAIGQREDGSVVFVVTDGRGKSGHIGACAQDLINIMHEYNVVDAANLDGGTSASMYYNENYEMKGTTVFLYQSSAYMPTAFVVDGPINE